MRLDGRPRWSDEARLTLLLGVLSFLICGVPRVYTQTAAHTLFITAHGAAAMPWAYLAEAACVPLAGALYIAATRRFSLRCLLLGTLATQVLALCLLRAGLAWNTPLVAGLGIVYFEIEFVLSSLLLWGLAGQLMTLRQGKRRFGFVSAGEPVAVIVCGLSAPALLRVLAPADLFLLSAAAAGGGAALALLILRRHPTIAAADGGFAARSDSASEPSVDDDAAPPPWWHNRSIVSMVVLVAVGQLAYFFVDNAFYLEAGHRYPAADDLAAFLGLYSAVMGAFSLLCGALLAPALLRRFGVRGGLLTLPLLLLAGAVATVSTAALGGPADALFLLVVGSKVIDQSLRYTLDKTTFVTLLQPLPSGQRLRVQAGLESMVEPLAGGVAGVLLFLMLKGFGFGAVGISGAVLCVACVWLMMVAVQYRGYVASLRAALAGLNGGRPEPQPHPIQPTHGASHSRQALLAEIDTAAAALSAWARLQHDPRPEAEPHRLQLAQAVSTSVKNCFGHLAGLLQTTDMRAAYLHYSQGGPQPRAYVLELLDNLLDAALKRRLLALLEPQDMAQQAARMQDAAARLDL
jgi:hypothetical protein